MESRLHVLVVDDEETMRDACQQTLVRDHCAVHLAGGGEEALAELAERRFDVVILDLRMPGIDGMDLLSRIRAEHPQTAVVVITGYATVESAVEAMRAGAADFVPKPFTPVTLRMIVRRAALERRQASENLRLKRVLRETNGLRPIIGKTPEMQAIFDLIRRVAPTDSTVLITGESGTGKELVARAIHRHSRRADGPFVVVDCGTLIGTLFESEVFGHVKGSFTGATATTHGRAELADGGTLFLDEVGSLDLNLQAKLLRVIQEREFMRVGSNQVIGVDVRIIAATNTDLLDAVAAGRFREDLFYRLSVVPVVLPPLRQRRDDIPALVEHFLKVQSAQRGKRVTGLQPEAMARLMQHDWPGNVRELANVIERAVVLAQGDEIMPDDLLYGRGRGFPSGRPPVAARDPRSADERAATWGRPDAVRTADRLTLADVERLHIEAVMRAVGGNRSKAAECLGIDRKTLWRKLRQRGRKAERPSG